ncbi:MAG: hypothetical protein ACYDEY_16445 [Acidimicrobiales bacterium]
MTSLERALPAPEVELDPKRPRLARNVRVALRRGPIVVVALIIGTVAALGISRLSTVKYESTALLVVAGTTNTATGANTLAATYAGFIPEDKGVQQALAVASGVTNPAQYATVGKRLVATVVTNSAIVSLAFAATTPQQAQNGLHVLVADLTNGVLQWKRRGQSTVGCTLHVVGTTPETQPPGVPVAKAAEVQYYCPVSPAIPLFPTPGYVVLVQDATQGVRTTPRSIKTGALGGALGLLLGLGAAIAWERTDPRADSLEDLRSEINCPVWDGKFTPAAAVSILDRWHQTVMQDTLQIGTVTVGRFDSTAVIELQKTIQQAAGREVVVFRPVDLAGPTILEGLDTHTPILILCIAQGTPLGKLRETFRRLGELGHVPDWVFLMRKSASYTKYTRRQSDGKRPLAAGTTPSPATHGSALPAKRQTNQRRSTGVGGSTPAGGKLR